MVKNIKNKQNQKNLYNLKSQNSSFLNKNLHKKKANLDHLNFLDKIFEKNNFQEDENILKTDFKLNENEKSRDQKNPFGFKANNSNLEIKPFIPKLISNFSIIEKNQNLFKKDFNVKNKDNLQKVNKLVKTTPLNDDNICHDSNHDNISHEEVIKELKSIFLKSIKIRNKKLKNKIVNKFTKEFLNKIKSNKDLTKEEEIENLEVVQPRLKGFFSLSKSINQANIKIRKFLENRNPTENLDFNNLLFSKLALFAFKDTYTQVFAKIAMTNSKKFSVFVQKMLMVATKIDDVQLFYLKKPDTFIDFFKQKKLTESTIVGLLFNLVTLIKTVDNLSSEIQKKFCTKFVGQKAYRTIRHFLDTYTYLLDFWLELERRGVFNQLISFKNVTKLMRYFWFPTNKRGRKFLKEPLLQTVSSNKILGLDPKKIQYLGFPMGSVRLSDTLFFWHAYTRKRILQNMWFFRSKKVFSKISILKKNKQANLNILPKLFNHNNLNQIDISLPSIIFDCLFDMKLYKISRLSLLNFFWFVLGYKGFVNFNKMFIKFKALKQLYRVNLKKGFVWTLKTKKMLSCFRTFLPFVKMSFYSIFFFNFSIHFNFKEIVAIFLSGFSFVNFLVFYGFFFKNQLKLPTLAQTGIPVLAQNGIPVSNQKFKSTSKQKNGIFTMEFNGYQ